MIRTLALCLLMLCIWVMHGQAHAQARGRAQSRAHAGARSKADAPKAKRDKPERKRKGKGKQGAEEKALEVAAPAPVAADEKPVPESGAAKPAAPAPVAVDDADVREEGGTQVKVMEFSGLDIEGQLKTPQMLYFLNRLRAEFGRPVLPHRSFMPELQRATQEKSMR